VSTPFSLLCLILFTDFHKNASFRPKMLNYLKTTFTFGKQTKDKFVNGKVQCKPTILIHSLIFVPVFSLGRVAGAAALRGPEIHHHQQKFQIVLLASTPGRDQARSEMSSRNLDLGQTPVRFPVGVDCSPKDLVRHSFLGDSGYMAELA